MNDEMNLPWKIYFFGEDGKYDKELDVLTIVNPKQMQLTEVRKAILYYVATKLEVRVCDSLDYCIIHWKDGKRIFP